MFPCKIRDFLPSLFDYFLLANLAPLFYGPWWMAIPMVCAPVLFPIPVLETHFVAPCPDGFASPVFGRTPVVLGKYRSLLYLVLDRCRSGRNPHGKPFFFHFFFCDRKILILEISFVLLFSMMTNYCHY